jgi:hypothetical protein
MAGFSRYALFSKDGSVPGYNAQLVLQPELKLGLFTAMTVGAGGRENVPFFSNTLALLNFAAAPPLYSYPQAFAHQPVLPTNLLAHGITQGVYICTVVLNESRLMMG